MNTLEEVDTTKVYHEFNFNSDQVTNLKCKQWFIHVDLISWMEEELNRLAEWDAIKILYKQVYHFEFSRVKCLEIYYKNGFDQQMAKLISNARYKMQWRGEMCYYVRNERGPLPQRVDEKLKDQDLQKYLIRSYKIKVDWAIEHSLLVFEFDGDLNSDQKLMLDEIFQATNSFEDPIFISRHFLFLAGTGEPPTIMKTEIFVAYHGQFLADLNIQDILALELANKDHRRPFYDRDLEHDIQMHLQTRFPMLEGNKKLKIYAANEFTNLKLLKYFIHKYRHCFSEILIPRQTLRFIDLYVIRRENHNLICNVLENSNFCVDVITPANVTVFSLTYRASKNRLTDLSEEPAGPASKYIHLDRDLNFNRDDLRIFTIQHKSFLNFNYYRYIEILIRTDEVPASLSVFVHELLEQIEKLPFPRNITVRLTALNNHINNSVLNMFLNRMSQVSIEFKNITFHLQSLLKWFSTFENNISISDVGFIECRMLLNRSRTKMFKNLLTWTRNSNKYVIPVILTFQNMNIEVDLPVKGKIVIDNCNIMPSVWSALTSTILDTVRFKNMTIVLSKIASLKCRCLEFDKCHIELRQAKLLSSDATMESVRNETVYFHDMDINVEALMKIADIKRSVVLSNSRILRQANVESHTNYAVNKIRITFKNMSIELKTLYTILYKFNRVTFEHCHILCTDNFIPQIAIKLKHLRFTEMPITRDLKTNLKYFHVTKPIEFNRCPITNEQLLEIWCSKRDQKLCIRGDHQINGHFYMELLAILYENRLDPLHHRFKDGIYFPFQNFIEIEWQYSTFHYIEWSEIQIRSVLVNDATIKLEYLRNGKVSDLFYELNELPNDSDICEVSFY